MYNILILTILGLILWNIVQSIKISNLEKRYDRANRELFDITNYLLKDDKEKG